MFPPLSAAIVAMTFIVDVAEQIPKLDLKRTCGGANSDTCVKSETAARDQLAEQWSKFPVAERTRCLRLTTISDMPSYVQVIICLEMARDARQSSSGAQEPTSSASEPKKKPKRP